MRDDGLDALKQLVHLSLILHLSSIMLFLTDDSSTFQPGSLTELFHPNVRNSEQRQRPGTHYRDK